MKPVLALLQNLGHPYHWKHAFKESGEGCLCYGPICSLACFEASWPDSWPASKSAGWMDGFETGWMDTNAVVTGQLICQSANGFKAVQGCQPRLQSIPRLPLSNCFKAVCFNGMNQHAWLRKCLSNKAWTPVWNCSGSVSRSSRNPCTLLQWQRNPCTLLQWHPCSLN